MKELEKDLSRRYRFSSLEVTRGDKMDFEDAKEPAKKETDTFILWLGFITTNDSSAVMYLDYTQYAILTPQTAEFVTKGTIEPRLTEIGYPGGVLQLPTTRRLPTLSTGMKESVRQISVILKNGGWFD